MSNVSAWLRNRMYNAGANWHRIKKQYEREGHIDIRNLQGWNRGPAIVMGSGVSLERCLPLLHRWDGALFGSASQFLIADFHNRPLDYLFVCDTGAGSEWKVRGPKQLSTLIAPPTCDPALLKTWKARKRYYLPVSGSEEHNISLSAMFPWITEIMINMGSAPNMMINLATRLGYSPIFLAGVDFCFPDNKEAFRNVQWEGQYHYSRLEQTYIDPSNPMYFEYEGHLTRRNQFYYMCDFYRLSIVIGNPYVIDCSDGLITELPKMDIEDVIKGYEGGVPELPEDLSVEKRSELSEKYTKLANEYEEGWK